MLQQASSDPTVVVQDFFAGKTFTYSTTPLSPLGINAIAHTKQGRCKSWDFRVTDSWSVGVFFKHHCCQLVIPKVSKSLMTFDTTEVQYHHITQPTLIPEDRFTNSLQQLLRVLQG